MTKRPPAAVVFWFWGRGGGVVSVSGNDRARGTVPLTRKCVKGTVPLTHYTPSNSANSATELTLCVGWAASISSAAPYP